MSGKKRNELTIDVRAIRRTLGLNQQQFWSPLGVTQSGGSRYESGRGMPKPVEKLVKLVHVDGLKNLDKVADLVKVATRSADELAKRGDAIEIASKLRVATDAVKGGAQ